MFGELYTGELFTKSMSVDWMPDWVRVVILCCAFGYVALMLATAVILSERYWGRWLHPTVRDQSMRPPFAPPPLPLHLSTGRVFTFTKK